MKKSMAMLLAGAMLVGGATVGTNISALAEEPVELTIWGWNAGDIEKVFDEYVNQTGANVTLNYVTVQTGEAFQKLQTTLASGLDMPDIVPSEAGQRGTMVSLDIWEDLSADPYNFDYNNIFEYQKALLTDEEGRLCFVPMDISGAALAYKKEKVKEYLGTDDPDELAAMMGTWEDLLECGKKVQEASNGECYMFASLTGVRQILDGQNPTPIIEDNKLNMESVKASLDIMAELYSAGVVNNMDESSAAYAASYADDVNLFYPCASWTPAYTIATNDPTGQGRWGLMLPPGGCYSWGGSAMGIPQAAPHKEEAWAFLNWFTSLEGCQTVYKLVNWNDSNPALYEDPEYAELKSDWFGDQNIGEILFVKAMENINVRPISQYDASISDVWTLVCNTMINDPSMTADQAAEMFEQEIRNKVPELE